VVAINNILDSKVDLKIHHLEITALRPEDEEKLNASFGFPLNINLSLLKGNDNTISLNIPITGDFQKPNFDASDAITQATSSAITSAIISYYTPFGLVMAVDGSIDLASTLKFAPVNFTAGSDDLDVSEYKGLTKLVQLMLDKPSIHLTLCAFSNSADREVFFPETKAIPLDQLKLEVEQSGKLIELGETRAVTVKQYLVNQKIQASRLVLCTAAHFEGSGLSGVEVSI
jgi:outer membrane protein OmpA-like peptidoglycan-associated protein